MSDGPVFARVRPARGWLWLVSANALFARSRLYWLQLILLYWMITVLVSLVPVVGVIAATLLKPVFAVGFLAAAWSQERGERPRLARLFDGFRSNISALLPLGAVYGAGIALAVVLSATMDGGALMRLVLFGAGETGTGQGTTPAVMATPGMSSAMILAAIAAIPTLLALWFAPALIVFQDQPPLRALALSLRSALANPGPIIVYWLAVLVFWIVVPGLIIAFFAMFGRSWVLFGVAVATPVTLGVVAVIHAADYVIYRDLFHHGESLAPTRD
jgi:hypothetical protein